MLNKNLQNVGLGIYKTLSRMGVMSHPVARSLFLKAYAFYKAKIEAGPVDRLQQLVRPGTTVIDVGANIGFFTLKFAEWVGPSGNVIAIEPDEENFSALRVAISRSPFGSRVITHKAVAAERPGVRWLERNEMHPGDHKIALGNKGIEVTAVSVDALVEQGRLPPVSLMKIDVQGAEMMVLAGARRMLVADMPALFVEIDDLALAHFGSSREALLAFLEELGYTLHALSADGATPSLSREQLATELAVRGYTDVLFLVNAGEPRSVPLHS
jgi:FkbM family methyltransferase